VFPEAVVAPYIVMAATDAVKYQSVCRNIYRFSPYQISSEDLERIHGTNECISLENIRRGILFFLELFNG
ncbi:MAG TPA: carboxypeptidase, partial [Bacillota bacterium]|nr:carboxypeptidase [Bacillota bacterium]